MEENRLKPMVDYDPLVFNDIFKKTLKLKHKLASGIDHTRFGLTHEDMVSFLDIKLIYVFNKYYHVHEPPVLLGHVIRGLQMMKNRILRAAYTKQFTQNIIEMGESEEYDNILHDDSLHNNNKDLFYDLALSFMEKNLSENAYELFQIQLNPPPYILRRLEEEGIKQTKIPSQVMAEYFDMDISNKSLNYIDELKQEINLAISHARDHFADLNRSLQISS